MISVTIPTYQRREFVLKAVDSVRRQHFQDWELLVVDDGSSDGTVEALERIREPRLRVIQQPHSGVSAARNRGVGRSRFEWIAFLDSDDCWKPRKLERQLEALEAEPVYRVCFTDEIWIRRGVRVNPKKKHRKQSGWIYPRCLELCLVSPSSILLHRQVLERVGLFDETFPVCEDYELWLRIACRYPVLYLPERLIVKTGGHADQLSQSCWGLDRFRVRAMLQSLESDLLTPQLRDWTIQEMLRKLEILAGGAEKRGKYEEAAEYRKLMDEWR